MTDLLSLALVNKCFQFESERLLYRTIKLISPSPPRVVRCLTTLTQVRRKAAVVRSFLLYLIDERIGCIARPLRGALRSMVGLEYLCLCIDPISRKEQTINRGLKWVQIFYRSPSCLTKPWSPYIARSMKKLLFPSCRPMPLAISAASYLDFQRITSFSSEGSRNIRLWCPFILVHPWGVP
jgi:hypothetical protein